MKRSDFNELKNLSVSELSKKAALLYKEFSDLVIEKNTRKVKDVKTASKKRKEVAQILTLVRQKTILTDLEAGLKQDKAEEKEVKAEDKKEHKKQTKSKKKGETKRIAKKTK